MVLSHLMETKMTTEEKLAKAIEFIKSIEKIDKRNYDTFDLNDIESESYAYCDECGDNVDFKVHWPRRISLNTEYIDYCILDDLSDKAWHILMDLTD